MNLRPLTRFRVIFQGALFCLIGACSALEEPDNRGVETSEGWQSLFDGETLAGWKVSQFGGEGWVRVREGAIYLFQGDSLTGVTWKGDFPKQDYELSLQAQRVRGSDFFCGMTFPVGASFCSLIVGGWAGSVVGISNVDGKDASENETSCLKKFENGRWYQIRVRVTPDRLAAWIDDELMVDLQVAGRRLEVRPEVRLSRPFGIASWQTTAAFKNIRVRSYRSSGSLEYEESAINP